MIGPGDLVVPADGYSDVVLLWSGLRATPGSETHVTVEMELDDVGIVLATRSYWSGTKWMTALYVMVRERFGWQGADQFNRVDPDPSRTRAATAMPSSS